MAAANDTEHPGTTPIDELLAVLPRWVERTRGQAELARSLAAMLPCVGGLVARRGGDEPAGVPEHERIDVLSVLAEEDPAASTAPGATASAHTATEPAVSPVPDEGPQVGADHAGDEAPVPSEGDLAIQDYDSLAASQVVPRLATLGAEELRSVQAYEAATRHRQTILNRVAQLLGER